MRRLSPILIVVALALVASGCGSDTKAANDYVDAVNKAQNDFASTFDRLSSQITSKSTPQQDQKTLDGFKQAVEPPSKVKPLHDELVNEIATYGKEIDKAKRAFAKGSPEEIVRAQTRLVTAVTRVSGQINRTIDAINKKLRE